MSLDVSSRAQRPEKCEQEQTMTDQTVKQTVLDELGWEPSVNAAHIGVTARDGIVSLTGHVASYAEKYAAQQAAGRVIGVKAIADELEVRYFAGTVRGDEEIAKQAVQVLAWDILVPNDKVKIKVDKGWVTLSGHLDWNYQKHSAETDVRKLDGVMGVTNMIVLKPDLQPSDVRKKIKDALDRNAQIESDDIHVSTDGGKVTLKGKVHTYFEKNLVERTAWSAPGVTAVDDQMTFA
jgi:osmotically-inducible protein OsmY